MNKLPDCGKCGLDIEYREVYSHWAMNDKAFLCLGCGLFFHFRCVMGKTVRSWPEATGVFQCTDCVQGEL